MTGAAPDICIYHANCDDGFAAAYAVWKRFGDGVKFIPAQYGGDIPDVAGKDVLIVDFSFKQAEMQRLADQARRIIVLDHHKTAEAELSGFTRLECVGGPFEKRYADKLFAGVGVCFDMNKSGCRLAWEYCFGDQPMPEWFAAVEDRDLWRFSLPATKEICISIRSNPRDFQIWDGFDAGELAVEGTAIRRYVDMIVSNICDTAFVENIGGHDVPVASCSYDFVSETANQLLQRNPNAPFAACLVRSYDGVTYSLRSMDDRMDVSEIAKANGGGGHRNAAGFRLKNTAPETPLQWLPIDRADKSTDRIYDYPGMPRPIGNSEEYWCRDADGRVFLATWTDDGKRAYWWDLEGESPVDPVEFMPHPLDPRWAALATEGKP